MNDIQEKYVYITIAAIIVLAMSYAIVKSLLNHAHNLRQLEMKKKIVSERAKHLFPMQVNAYERMITYLERIKPSAMVYRNNAVASNIMQMQAKMLSDLREEFQHNQSVQMYISSQAWGAVELARDESKEVVKIAAQNAGGEATTQLFSQEIFRLEGKLGQTAAEKAVKILRSEMQSYLKG